MTGTVHVAARTIWATTYRTARAARRAGRRDEAWATLERAHILSQPCAGPHLRTHLTMLRWAVADRDLREVAGQALRAVLAPIGSWTRRYPLGNTGRARISAFAPMPIPADLQRYVCWTSRGAR